LENGAPGEVNGGPKRQKYGKTSISITTSGLIEPEVVLSKRARGRKLIPESLQAKWRLHGPKYDENAHPLGANGQTGSRNMAATRFLDFSTLTSYSTPNTLWGLTRTVLELPGGNLSITPLLRPSDLEIFRISMTDARFFRNSTNFFSNSNNAISFTFSRALVGQGFCRFVPKKSDTRVHSLDQKQAKVRQKPNFKFSNFPKMGGNSPRPSTIFIRPLRR